MVEDSRCTTGCTNPSDPDLARVIAAWPSLSAPIRAAMLAIIQSAASVPGTAPAASGKAKKGETSNDRPAVGSLRDLPWPERKWGESQERTIIVAGESANLIDR